MSPIYLFELIEERNSENAANLQVNKNTTEAGEREKQISEFIYRDLLIYNFLHMEREEKRKKRLAI